MCLFKPSVVFASFFTSSYSFIAQFGIRVVSLDALEKMMPAPPSQGGARKGLKIVDEKIKQHISEGQDRRWEFHRVCVSVGNWGGIFLGESSISENRWYSDHNVVVELTVFAKQQKVRRYFGFSNLDDAQAFVNALPDFSERMKLQGYGSRIIASDS